MTIKETTPETDALLEDFKRLLADAHPLGVEDGLATTDYQTASQFAQCHQTNTLVEHWPALPEEVQDQVKDMIREGQLANNQEVINEYVRGFAEGCAKAIETMNEARRRQESR